MKESNSLPCECGGKYHSILSPLEIFSPEGETSMHSIPLLECTSCGERSTDSRTEAFIANLMESLAAAPLPPDPKQNRL